MCCYVLLSDELVLRGQTLFFVQGRYHFQYKRPARGAYTESDNASARKIGFGHVRLVMNLVHVTC